MRAAARTRRRRAAAGAPMSAPLFNFSPGPAMLPPEVHARVRALLAPGDGVPLLELGHRTPEFDAVIKQSDKDLRALLDIPDEYRVLFVPGGATAQYAMAAMNLARPGQPFDHFDTGHWAARAMREAARYGRVHVVARLNEDGPLALPDAAEWRHSEDAAYCHFVDNETLTGFEFPPDAVAAAAPLVADMTSNFLTRPFDVRRYGVVYAGAQKNAGIAGLAIVIVREDLCGRALPETPALYDYKTLSDSRCLHNTPPVFAWQVCALTLAWTLAQGGLAEMRRRAAERAAAIYNCIDASEIYANNVAPRWRSRVNAHFRITPRELEPKFLERASARNLVGLRGHRAVGGIRASMYNAMPLAGAQALVECMRDFEREAGAAGA